ncbi:MAG: 4-alpha-glucanotransferase [Cyanobacteriota bacterium]
MSNLYKDKGGNLNDTFLMNKFDSEEIKEYKKVLNETLNKLEKKNLSLIVHGPSFPSLSDEDTGIGSPYSSGARTFMKFLSELGFNSIQLGPSGKTKIADASPYTSTIFSDNILFIDLKDLTTEKWLNILSESTFKSIVQNNDKKDKSIVNYEYAYQSQHKALKEAWTSYKYKLQKQSLLNLTERNSLNKIQEKFEEYKNRNKDWLEHDALYQVLIIENGSDYWCEWTELDQNLPLYMISDLAEEKLKAEKRINEIHSKSELVDEIEFYKFCQFIVEEQRIASRQAVDMKTIADIQVTYSDRDWWAFQGAFLKKSRLGVPPDYFSVDGQAWGFPAINPDKIYLRDSKGNIIVDKEGPIMAEAGKLIFARFNKVFKDNPGGVRIDHIVGLIDPWVYPLDAPTPKYEDGGKRLFSSPEIEDPFKTWAYIKKEDLDLTMPPDKEKRVKIKSLTEVIVDKYSIIIDIIIKAAKNNNVPVSNIICEDLGTLTNPVVAVLEDRELSGLRVTQFVDPLLDEHMYRGKNVESKQWIVIGTHDNDTMISWVQTLQKNKELAKHAQQLAEDLNLDPEELSVKPEYFIQAKFAELFASPAQNIQIMFTDLFGINDRYNDPGAKGQQLAKNWRVRVPNDYISIYSENLTSQIALNLPLALYIAMNSKDKKFIEDNKILINKLKDFAEKIK